MTHLRAATLCAATVLMTASVASAQGAQAPAARPAPAPSPACGPGQPASSKSVDKASRCFEMRTYSVQEGSSIELLHNRFRTATNRLFVKHGMQLVGYWQPVSMPNTLIYILADPSREAAKKSWAAFGADPEWKKVRDESHKDGVLVKKVESVFVDATDYSPIK